jgi:hypothetical protein
LSEVNNGASEYNEQSSQQPKNGAEPPSPAARARAVAVALLRAESVIGSRGGPGLHARARHILDCARESRLPPRDYALAYFLYRTFKSEHVISDVGQT